MEEDLTIDVDPVTRCRRGYQALTRGGALALWTEGSFRLELFDTAAADARGGTRLAYRFFDQRLGAEPIFEAEDFCASPLDAIDSPATIAGLLTFLSLGAGDAGAEAFAGYDERQLEWRELYAEELALCALALKEPGS